MKTSSWTAVALIIALAGCGREGDVVPPEDDPLMQQGVETSDDRNQTATARLRDAEGNEVGTATATAENGDVRLELRVQDLTPGERGAHIHMVGQCDAPTFESAGSHWNPTNQQHGLENPEGQHAGDMPNLTVDDDGSGTLDYTLEGGTFAGLMDADGSAMVIHASADDQMTDPAGNSGDRIACGVFEREGGEAAMPPA